MVAFAPLPSVSMKVALLLGMSTRADPPRAIRRLRKWSLVIERPHSAIVDINLTVSNKNTKKTKEPRGAHIPGAH